MGAGQRHSQELAALRAERNKNIYEPWKMDVLKAIRSSRGERLPWKQAR